MFGSGFRSVTGQFPEPADLAPQPGKATAPEARSFHNQLIPGESASTLLVHGL